MDTAPHNLPLSTEPQKHAGITRRSFIKRTSATVVVTVLALHAFRSEVYAQEAGGYSDPLKTIQYNGGAASPFRALGILNGSDGKRYQFYLRATCEDQLPHGKKGDAWSFTASAAIFARELNVDDTETGAEINGEPDSGSTAPFGVIKKTITD